MVLTLDLRAQYLGKSYLHKGHCRPGLESDIWKPHILGLRTWLPLVRTMLYLGAYQA